MADGAVDAEDRAFFLSVYCNLRGAVGMMPLHLVLIATLLLLVGLGTKAGLAPFHPWVADAPAEAPAVMSAFLSSVIIKVPFVTLPRV